jgi:hypothetical protein
VAGAEEQLVLAAGDAQGTQPGRAEAIGDMPRGEPCQLPQRADPEPPHRLDRVAGLALGQAQTLSQRRDREIREESRHTNVCSYSRTTESTYERFLF